MNRIFATLLLQIISIGPPQQPAIPDDDPRPPVIQVKLSDSELAKLKSARAAVAEAQAKLDHAQAALDYAQNEIIEAHQPKENKEYFGCGEIAYIGSIERMFLVYRLGYRECHPV